MNDVYTLDLNKFLHVATLSIPVLKNGRRTGVSLKIDCDIETPRALVLDIAGRLTLSNEWQGSDSKEVCHCAGNQAVCVTCGLRIVG